MDEDITSLLRTAADLTRKNPTGAKEILEREPKWAYTIFHALLLAGVITPEDAERVINGEPLVNAATQQNASMPNGFPFPFPLPMGFDAGNGFGLTEENKETIRMAFSLTDEEISKLPIEKQRVVNMVRQHIRTFNKMN